MKIGQEIRGEEKCPPLDECSIINLKIHFSHLLF